MSWNEPERRKRAIRRVLDRVGRMVGDQGQTAKGFHHLGYVPNLIRPRTLNEKLLRRKLRPFPAEWSVWADKIAVRELVRDRVGAEYLNELYFATRDPETIPFEALPGDFVVKANHGSGWNVIVRDGAYDRQAVIRQCAAWLAQRYGSHSHEPWYDLIPPTILIERFLHDAAYGAALDVKFWVFHGRTQYVQTNVGRLGVDLCVNFYDRQWRPQDWGYDYYPRGAGVRRPGPLEEMMALAEQLAGSQPFVRVDLYVVNDRQVLFGEMTYVPDGGYGRFRPDATDAALGALW